MSVKAIRGAIQISANSKEEIRDAVHELFPEILRSNNIGITDVISVIITCTPDITAEFPAGFAREIGFGNTPLLCAVEMNVEGAMKLVIRTLMHVNMDGQASHVYLRGAYALRKDIAQ